MQNTNIKKELIQRSNLSTKLNDIKNYIRQGYKLNMDQKA